MSDLIADKGAAFWIGLNDRDSEGDWQETSGESNEYRNWGPGEPDGRSSYKSDRTMQFICFLITIIEIRVCGMIS